MSEYYQQSVEKLRTSDLSEAEINEKIAKMDQFQELYENPVVKIGIPSWRSFRLASLFR